MQEADGSQPVWLGIAQVAGLLGISVSRAYALAADGVVPSVKVGGRIRVPREAFDRWMAEQAARAMSSLREQGEGGTALATVREPVAGR